MKHSHYAILFSFLFLGLACQSFDESGAIHEPLDEISPLRVATSGDYQPFSDWPLSRDEFSSSPQGYSVDVARAFANAHSEEIEWVRFRWPNLLSELQAGRFDFAISGITVRPERSIAGLFSLPLTTSGAIVLVPAGSDLSSPEDLDQPEIRLAVNAGGHLERVARKLFPRAMIEALDQNSDVLDRLADAGAGAGAGAERGADGVVTDTLEAPHWQARSDSPLRRIGPLTTDRKAALFEPSKRELARRFDAWLLDAEASGELDRLRAQHGLSTARTANPMAALLASIDERLALMIDVARTKRILSLPVEDRYVEARVLHAAWKSVEAEARASDRVAPPRVAVERLFHALIEAAKSIQRAELADRSTDSDVAPIKIADAEAVYARTLAREELDEALRPALIRIGDRIAMLVVRIGSSDTKIEFSQVQRSLGGHGLPETKLQPLYRALLDLLPSEERDASTHRSQGPGTDLTSIE